MSIERIRALQRKTEEVAATIDAARRAIEALAPDIELLAEAELIRTRRPEAAVSEAECAAAARATRSGAIAQALRARALFCEFAPELAAEAAALMALERDRLAAQGSEKRPLEP